MNESINEFVKSINIKYPVNFKCEHNQDEDLYYLWHNGIEKIVNSDEFIEDIAINIIKCFWEKDIFNICIGFNPKKIDVEWNYTPSLKERVYINSDMIIESITMDSYLHHETSYFLNTNIEFNLKGLSTDKPKNIRYAYGVSPNNTYFGKEWAA